MLEAVVLALVLIVLVAGVVFSFVRPRDEDEPPATLEGGGPHTRHWKER